MEKKYTAYTLLEMLVVMGIIMILGGMSFSSFYGLHDTVKMNEYVLNMEQDIRSIQRSAMLLERNTEENWLYGLGIDFSELENDGKYTPFKWCSSFTDYGDPTTRMIIPAYPPSSVNLDSARLPILAPSEWTVGLCSSDQNILKFLPGYQTSLTIPKATISFNTHVRYVLFESVSGRAFFYDSAGELLNYEYDNDLKRPVILDADDLEHFEVIIDSSGAAAPRIIRVHHLSGRIDNIVQR